MNNIEKELYDVLNDMFTNRPKDISGSIIKYSKDDLSVYIKLMENLLDNCKSFSEEFIKKICELFNSNF